MDKSCPRCKKATVQLVQRFWGEQQGSVPLLMSRSIRRCCSCGWQGVVADGCAGVITTTRYERRKPIN